MFRKALPQRVISEGEEVNFSRWLGLSFGQKIRKPYANGSSRPQDDINQREKFTSSPSCLQWNKAMSISDDAYSKAEVYAEVFAAGQRLPERGPLCPHCQMHIPQFADLRDDDTHRIRHLALSGRPIIAIAEMRSLTGCPLTWAQIWVEHGGEPKPLFGETPPCPQCGQPLRTSLAKQCRFCHADWHE